MPSRELTGEEIAEIIRRVVHDCADPEVAECRFWECQKHNRCKEKAP